jgi:hypothetical protein
MATIGKANNSNKEKQAKQMMRHKGLTSAAMMATVRRQMQPQTADDPISALQRKPVN